MSKAIFWDLLGTLGGNSQTLITEFSFFKEAIPTLRRIQENGFLNLVITNQSHIAHGRFTMKVFEKNIQLLKKECINKGAKIEKIYVCPHKRADNCSCKKPKPELVLKAQADFDIDLNKSYVVGDTVKNDIGLAQAVGAKSILVLTGDGKESLENEQKKENGLSPDFIAENLLDVVKIINNS